MEDNWVGGLRAMMLSLLYVANHTLPELDVGQMLCNSTNIATVAVLFTLIQLAPN